MAITQDNSRLRELNICRIDLSTVNPRLISNSIANLVSVHVGNTNLTVEQLEAIFQALENTPKLREFNISSNDLSNLSPILITTILSNLVYINLSSTSLTSDQVDAIFSSLTRKNCTVSHINLTRNDLSHISPTVFLAELVLTKLTTRQVRMLLTKVTKKNSQLKKLDTR